MDRWPLRRIVEAVECPDTGLLLRSRLPAGRSVSGCPEIGDWHAGVCRLCRPAGTQSPRLGHRPAPGGPVL